MLRALLKKQLLETYASFFNRKSSQKKSLTGRKSSTGKRSIFLYIFLAVYILGAFGFIFYNMMSTMCAPMAQAGLLWLFFALAGIMATVLAVIGTVFMTQSQLYNAKDNELLLSMPISPAMILLCRMLNIYVQNFLFEALVMIPAYIAYLVAGQSVTPFLFISWAVLLLLLPLLSTALSCILGFLVALITARMRNKTIFTVIFSLSFIVAYYYFYIKMNSYLQYLIANSTMVGNKIRSSVHLAYQMGQAGCGDIFSLLIFLLVIMALFAVIYLALSLSFIHITTTKRGAAKIVYHEKTVQSKSVDSSLLGKELRRFFGSSVYLLNCGLGSFILLAGCIFLAIKRQWLVDTLASVGFAADMIITLLTIGVCLIVAMNAVTAPSVSLEGSNLWIVKSAPIPARKILAAKLKLHILVTAPFALVFSVVAAFVLDASPLMAIMMFVLPQFAILLSGEIGLLFDLRWHNFNWTSEAVAVKQSTSVVFTMLAVLGLATIMLVPFFIVMSSISAQLYLFLCMVLVVTLAVVFYFILFRKGVKKFENI